MKNTSDTLRNVYFELQKFYKTLIKVTFIEHIRNAPTCHTNFRKIHKISGDMNFCKPFHISF
eukprot:TRINITY_DN16155_c0_g1_i1.p1 TRINITY_DN16155_c0_g1~~TRINITY_DN16155_c0_g1_i1.p1  ORF type:complete len:62 (+),score=10.45 TRINITY_DN16155_c0_g1_i1:131-316(+)